MSVWEEQSTEGTSGRVQRVAAAGGHAAYTRSQTAYRAYIDHGTTCADCGETRCTVSDDLWQAYSDVKEEADQG